MIAALRSSWVTIRGETDVGDEGVSADLLKELSIDVIDVSLSRISKKRNTLLLSKYRKKQCTVFHLIHVEIMNLISNCNLLLKKLIQVDELNKLLKSQRKSWAKNKKGLYQLNEEPVLVNREI